MHRPKPHAGRNLLSPFRQRKSVIALALAWLFALQTLLGGLALARIVPAQHAAALTGQTLCLPGGSETLPASSHDHEACQLCPHAGNGPALPRAADLPVPAPLARSEGRLAIREAFAGAGKPDVRASGPRAPPSIG